MSITCAYPGERPPPLAYTSMQALFAQFEKLFLTEATGLQSASGHRIQVFDHHFFHLAAVTTANEPRLFMLIERALILATVDGFGKYIIGHNHSRARNLPSALATMSDPDEVWDGNANAKSAEWVYVREFNSAPYPFTISLLARRPAEGNIIVPVSSFPCRAKDVKRWRQERRIYQKHEQPPCGG